MVQEVNDLNRHLGEGQQLFIEEFMTKRKLLFLDIDGVLNSQRWYESCGSGSIEDARKWIASNRDEFGMPFATDSADLLNKLIEKFDLSVVISSTWRSAGLKEMQKMWKSRSMSGEVIGITPHLDHRNRGLEIEQYLKDTHHFMMWNWDWKSNVKNSNHYYQYLFTDIENYVIIDDDSDMTYSQRNHFCKVANKEGFIEDSYDKCVRILNTPIKKTLTNYHE